MVRVRLKLLLCDELFMNIPKYTCGKTKKIVCFNKLQYIEDKNNN